MNKRGEGYLPGETKGVKFSEKARVAEKRKLEVEDKKAAKAKWDAGISEKTAEHLEDIEVSFEETLENLRRRSKDEVTVLEEKVFALPEALRLTTEDQGIISYLLQEALVSSQLGKINSNNQEWRDELAIHFKMEPEVQKQNIYEFVERGGREGNEARKELIRKMREIAKDLKWYGV